MRQWMLRITAYAERLLQDLDTIDWSESLKEMQRNWIGRSEGAEVEFAIADGGPPASDAGATTPNRRSRIAESRIVVFTTRPDTLFGATYMVLAPEHKLVDQITHPAQREAVAAYKEQVAKKSDLERTELAKDKTGVFTGAYAINSVNGERIPIWIADYVLASYGTGAIMAVPGHDTRDLEFARKFNLPIRVVVQAPVGQDSVGFVGDGVSVDSGLITGLPTPEAKKKITAWLEQQGCGRRTINYKLRDWLFSRQRYWGEPFPILWKEGHHEALPEGALPLTPPDLDDFKPTATGEPPLARAKEWVNLPDGSTRETNTMPQWAGSCWYYLRYLDARNSSAFCGKDAERYWMGADSVEAADRHSVDATETAPPASTLQPVNASTTPGVDLYVGGTEHAVLHLLYARFWHKVLYDLGHVSTPEPFFKLVNQGLILGEDGQKMSKSRGNVINPDDILKDYGADAFRLYEMFMGPLEMVKPWSTKGVEGVYRFLGRVWRLFVDEKSETEFEQNLTSQRQRGAEWLEGIQLSPAIQPVEPAPPQLKTLHACIKKVTEDLEGLRFNTAISALMVFVNEAMTWDARPITVLRTFLILLQPFAPHLAEELWHKLSQVPSPKSQAGPADERETLDLGPWTLDLAYQPWPQYDPGFLVEETLEIPVQVNGKLRDVIRVPAAATPQQIEAAARQAEKAQPFLTGKTIRKVIQVPKKLVNIVVS
jgi:leucyl-tRNA synthetase